MSEPPLARTWEEIADALGNDACAYCTVSFVERVCSGVDILICKLCGNNSLCRICDINDHNAQLTTAWREAYGDLDVFYRAGRMCGACRRVMPGANEKWALMQVNRPLASFIENMAKAYELPVARNNAGNAAYLTLDALRGVQRAQAQVQVPNYAPPPARPEGIAIDDEDPGPAPVVRPAHPRMRAPHQEQGAAGYVNGQWVGPGAGQNPGGGRGGGAYRGSGGTAWIL